MGVVWNVSTNHHPNMETVTEVKHFAAGFIGIGWTLQALNANSELIAQCSKKDFGCLGIDNGAKFEDFLARSLFKGFKGYSCETNEYDRHQWCLCKPGEKVSKISSVHNNKKEDRKWTLTCSRIEPEFNVPNVNTWYEETEWTEYDNLIRWNGKLENKFLVGMTSVHNNTREDRKFKFFTARSDDWYLTDCVYHQDINDWDRKLQITLGGDEVISYLSSYHSNKHEDRIWIIEVCKLRKKCTEISKIQYDTVKSDVTREEVFAGRQIFDNKNGQSENSFIATISKTASNSLTESYTFSRTSGWTAGVSMSITAGATFGLPGINEASLELTAGASASWNFGKTWTRSNSTEYSEKNGRKMSYKANCKAGCVCTLDVVVKTAKGVIPYKMWSQSVDKKHQCVEEGELKVDYSFDGTATVNDVC